MNRRDLLFILLTLSAISRVHGQTVVFEGTIPSYKGQVVEIQTYLDYLSGSVLPLQKVPVNNAGYFEVSFEVQQPTKVIFAIGELSNKIHVQGGNIYQLTFNKKNELIQIQSSDETNTQLKKLDDAIESYYKKHVKWPSGDYKNSFSQEMDEFTNSIYSQYISDDNIYLNDHIKYKMGYMYFFANVIKTKDITAANKLEENLLTNSNVLYSNTTYMWFLTQFYFFRFNSFDLRHFPSYPEINVFDGYLHELSAITNDTVKQIAILSACRNAYTARWAPKKAVLNNIVDSIENVALSPEVQAIATNLYRKYNDLTTGQQIKDFTLYNVEGNTQKLSDLRGKYILLDFWFVGCSYCIKAMPVKSKLKQELTNFDIVSIDPVDDLERMNSWIRKKNYNWTFLNAKGNKSLLDYFTIDSYPTYFLISPTGELLYQSKDFELSNIYKHIVSIVRSDH